YQEFIGDIALVHKAKERPGIGRIRPAGDDDLLWFRKTEIQRSHKLRKDFRRALREGRECGKGLVGFLLPLRAIGHLPQSYEVHSRNGIGGRLCCVIVVAYAKE